MEGRSELHEETKVPLKWIIGLSSLVIALSVSYAAMKIGQIENATEEVRGEIRGIRESVSSLNINVSILLNERDHTKEEINDLKLRMKALER